MTEPNYFTSLVNDLNTRAARAVVSQMGVNSNALRHHLQAIFEQEPGRRGSFLADPVFEATFPWQTAREEMDDLSGQLLHPDLIAAMDQPPEPERTGLVLSMRLLPLVGRVDPLLAGLNWTWESWCGGRNEGLTPSLDGAGDPSEGPGGNSVCRPARGSSCSRYRPARPAGPRGCMDSHRTRAPTTGPLRHGT